MSGLSASRGAKVATLVYCYRQTPRSSATRRKGGLFRPVPVTYTAGLSVEANYDWAAAVYVLSFVLASQRDPFETRVREGARGRALSKKGPTVTDLIRTTNEPRPSSSNLELPRSVLSAEDSITRFSDFHRTSVFYPEL